MLRTCCRPDCPENLWINDLKKSSYYSYIIVICTFKFLEFSSQKKIWFKRKAEVILKLKLICIYTLIKPDMWIGNHPQEGQLGEWWLLVPSHKRVTWNLIYLPLWGSQCQSLTGAFLCHPILSSLEKPAVLSKFKRQNTYPFLELGNDLSHKYWY